jgi:hypothetical protein
MKILVPRTRPEDPGVAAAERRWLWHGYLATGKITLLTSQWKSGKTTLIAIILARMAQGGQLADLAVAPARAVVISEEGPDNWESAATNSRLVITSRSFAAYFLPCRASTTGATWCTG